MLASHAPAHAAGAARLLEVVYQQLHRLARLRMAQESPDHTLQATALVHEAYARLVGTADIDWQGKAHFFAAAAEAMRRILVEHARAKGRLKRGGVVGGGGGGGASGPRRRIPLSVLDLADMDSPDEILSVDEAFRRLQEMDPDLARVVHLRFFAGLTEQEVALSLGISDRTVRREWTVAKAWLRRWLDEQAGRHADSSEMVAQPPTDQPDPRP
jgi:RNA polymerase sigma factor (TIGR02999 family)